MKQLPVWLVNHYTNRSNSIKKMKNRLFLFLLTFFMLQPAIAGLFDNADEEPPTQEEAYQLAIDVEKPDQLIARFTVAPGNYLYRDKIKFEIAGPQPIQILPYQLPEGKIKNDEIFGPTAVFFNDISVPLILNRSEAPQQVTVTAHYQGCSETFNICYPPTKTQYDISLPAFDKANSSTQDDMSAANIDAPLSEQDRLAASLANDSLMTILLSFFGIGILLAFTPCVFPMIPILSSIIVGEGDNISTKRAFTLSLVYVLAMSVTYTIAGLITGLLGANIQTMLQNPWVIGSFSLLFVVLSLSMFGLYELQLPQSLQDRLHQMSQKQKGGKLAGVALMGLLSGLIVGPCLAPPLAGALIFIGQQGDPILGASALFAMSMGMGLPLLAIGTSAGSLLPKAGAWMENIKSVFGVMMIALAIWMLERIIPIWAAMVLWGSLLVVVAVYMNAFSAVTTGWQKLVKGFGLVFFIYGTFLLIGSVNGSHNFWQPLQGMASGGSGQSYSAGVQFTPINNLADLEQQLQQTQQLVMLDLYADWCVDCKTMEMTTFKDPTVISTLSNTVSLKLDMTDNNDEHKAFLKQFGIFGPPTILFFDPQGEEYRQFRLVGAMNATDFQQHLLQIPAIAK